MGYKHRIAARQEILGGRTECPPDRITSRPPR